MFTKSVRNRCLIELFCGVVCVVTLPFWHFCWCGGFCHGTGSDLFLFLLLGFFSFIYERKLRYSDWPFLMFGPTLNSLMLYFFKCPFLAFTSVFVIFFIRTVKFYWLKHDCWYLCYNSISHPIFMYFRCFVFVTVYRVIFRSIVKCLLPFSRWICVVYIIIWWIHAFFNGIKYRLCSVPQMPVHCRHVETMGAVMWLRMTLAMCAHA